MKNRINGTGNNGMARKRLLANMGPKQLGRLMGRTMQAVFDLMPPDADFVLVLGADGRLVSTASNLEPESDTCGLLRAALDEARVNTIENN